MRQINENLLELNVQDSLDESLSENYLKIFLSGPIDLNNTFDWHSKFISGVSRLVDPKEGDPRLNNNKYIILNSKIDISNPDISLENPEFVSKIQWELQMIDKSDVIFCNFLKKSKSPFGMNGFMLSAMSNKIIVRCLEEYMYYPYIKLITDTYNIPLLGDTSTIIDVLFEFYKSIPKFNKIINYGF